MPYKHDYDKTLTRLTNILSKLNDGEALSVKELAEEFNVSTRTIQRDFNERLISFPIYKDGKKWKMQDGFRLEKTTSIEDAVVLDIMEGLIGGSSGAFANKAKNLLAKLKNKDYNPIYTKLDIEDISDKLVEVQHLDFRNDVDVLKKYYLKNVTKIKISDDTFKSNSKLDATLDNALSIWFDEDAEPFEVKLLISSSIAKYFKRKPISKNQTIESIFKDGSMEVVVKITHEMEIMPLVKYWIPHVQALEPM